MECITGVLGAIVLFAPIYILVDEGFLDNKLSERLRQLAIKKLDKVLPDRGEDEC